MMLKYGNREWDIEGLISDLKRMKKEL